MTKLRILLAEDEPAIQTVVQLALELGGGHEVKICSAGPEALQVAVAWRPDLFLLDVMMPGMTGPQVMAALQQLPGLGEVPVIFLTAKVQPSEVASYIAAGALDVIAKPFDPMQLSRRIETIMAGRPITANPARVLPVRSRPAAPLAAAPVPQVLVVEDDPEIAYLLDFILGREGFQVSVAADGQVARSQIETRSPPALVLLDLMLPYVGGMQLLQLIRNTPAWQLTPVVMLTAKGQEGSIVAAIEQGANDYILKPFQPPELVARLRRLIKSTSP